MGYTKTDKKAHDDTMSSAESTRQAAVSSSSQSTTRTAEIAYFRAARASAIANGVSPTPFIFALIELGAGGT